MSVGTVVERETVLLGQEKDCKCGGVSQAGYLSTETSTPNFRGKGYGRYCPECKERTDLDTVELERAKADYAVLNPSAAQSEEEAVVA